MAAQHAVDDVRAQLASLSASIHSSPAVQRLLAHPIFDHELFKHPVFQHAVLRDPIILAAVAGLIVILLVFSCFPSGSSSATARRRGTPTVLLIGPPDSGKTSLFIKLSQDERPATHTSLVPSSATVSIPDDGGRPKAIRVVDLAGHARLRDQVAKHVEDADAVVFVVDVVGLVRNAGPVAEELAPLLTQLAGAASRRGPSASPPRLLLLAHKSDLLMRAPASEDDPASPPELTPQAKSTAHERVRSILTREMDRLKAARGAGGVGGRIEGMAKVQSGGRGWWARLFGGGSSAPEADAGSAEDDEALVWGGAGPFRWEDIEGIEVDWAVSGLGPVATDREGEDQRRGNGLDELTEFMWGL